MILVVADFFVIVITYCCTGGCHIFINLLVFFHHTQHASATFRHTSKHA